MEIIPAVLIGIVGIIALVLIIKFVGGCLLRVIFGLVIVALAVYLIYQFVLS